MDDYFKKLDEKEQSIKIKLDQISLQKAEAMPTESRNNYKSTYGQYSKSSTKLVPISYVSMLKRNEGNTMSHSSYENAPQAYSPEINKKQQNFTKSRASHDL